MKYYKFKAKRLITVKNLITVEFLNLPKNYFFPEESHDFWEMIYVDKNSMLYILDGKQIILHEGELLFVMPNQKHSIYSNNTQEASIFVLCFDCSSPITYFFNGYKSTLNIKNKNYIKEIILEAKNTFKFPFKEKLLLLDNPNIGGQQSITTNLELLLIHLLREEQNKQVKQIEFIKDEDFAENLVDKICEYLSSHVCEKIIIQDICNTFNYSKSYLSRIFKQIKNTSIIDYFNNLKINEAKKLIKETDMTLKEISEKLYFSDHRYFHALFKKITKMTPKQYKNSVLQ